MARRFMHEGKAEGKRHKAQGIRGNAPARVKPRTTYRGVCFVQPLSGGCKKGIRQKAQGIRGNELLSET